MSIGDRIRDLRWDRRLKQGELARRAGIAQNTLSRIELGEATPSVPTLEKLARGLSVDLSDLLEEPVPAMGKAEAPQAGQSEQEWAKEQGFRLHGMTDAEWNTHVRALSAKELEEEFRELFEEAKMLHAAYSIHKWQHPEDKDRRVAMFHDLSELRAFRLGDLAVAAKLKEEDELFEEMIRALKDVAV
jgi:transcriptional regulator with XRE-family HTH domain